MKTTDSGESIQRVSFGIFEADLRSGELRRRGKKINLHGKPFEVLSVLLRNAGDVVTRETLHARLWPDGTHVDFDHNLNNAVNRLREVLRDRAESPRFIETLPRRGYRFIAPVKVLEGTAVRSNRHWPWVAAAAAAAAVAIAAVLLLVSPGVADRDIVAAPDPDSLESIRLAVLPFRNLSGDPEQGHISDGLTEELILRLGQLQPDRLRVLARTSSERYEAADKSVAEIGRELAAHFLLEGSFRLSEDRIRVTARLVQVSDESQLWSEVYDREQADVLILQSDVAQQVAEALSLELLPAVRGRLAAAEPVNPRAQQAYWKGRYRWDVIGLGGFENAFLSFHEALREDPDYAPAYLGLADAYFKLAYWRLVEPEPALRRSLNAAETAMSLEPDLATARAVRARARHLLEWDWAGTRSILEEAVAAEPGSYILQQWYGELLAMQGEWEEGVRRMQLAQELNPTYAVPHTAIGWHYLLAGRFEEAERQLQAAIERDPERALHYYDLGRVYLAMGRPGDAVKPLEMSFERAVKTHTWAALAAAHHQAGNREYAGQLRDQLYGLAELRYVSRVDLAFLELGFGQLEAALDQLERGAAEVDPWIGYLKVDPVYGSLHGHPRYERMLGQIGF